MRKLITGAYRSLLRLSARCNAPRLAAKLLRRALIDQRPGSRPKSGAGVRYRVLCMGRSIFSDDVQALAGCPQGQSVQFLALHKGILDEIYRVLVGESPDGDQLNEFNYHHTELASAARRRYREFLGKVVDHWQADGLRFDAFLSGNFGYYQQQELIVALQERSVPFVCLFKEGLLIPEYLEGIAARYIDGKVFLGKKIIFYSEPIRRAVLRSDAFREREFSTAVCGIPRLDALVGLPPAERKQIVFFSFYPEAKFNSFVDDPVVRAQAIERGDAYHRAVFQFAVDHPEWSLVIKTKAGDRYSAYIIDQWAVLGAEMPDNVRLTTSDSATKLLAESRVVITFLSITSVEALVAERQVICPDFSDLFQGGAWDYFHRDPHLVNYTRNADDIAVALAADRGGEGDGETADRLGSRDRFLDRMVHGADGMASDRVCGEIIETIESVRNSTTDLAGKVE